MSQALSHKYYLKGSPRWAAGELAHLGPPPRPQAASRMPRPSTGLGSQPSLPKEPPQAPRGPLSCSGLLVESEFSQANAGRLLSLEVEIALLTSKVTAVYHQFLLHANVSENRDTITADN